MFGKNKSKIVLENKNWILIVFSTIVKHSRYSKPDPFREIENESQTIIIQSWRDSFIKINEPKPHVTMSKLNEIRRELAILNKVPINSVMVQFVDYIIGDEVFLQSLDDVNE